MRIRGLALGAALAVSLVGCGASSGQSAGAGEGAVPAYTYSADDPITDDPITDAGDDNYLSTVQPIYDKEHSSWGEARIIAFGHRTCHWVNLHDLLWAITKANKTLHFSDFDAGFVVGAAQTTICIGSD